MYTSPCIRTIFCALLGIGVGATASGTYKFFTSLPSWPDEVKSDLRSGIKARHRNDHAKCAAYLDRAWKTTLSLPLDKFGPDPLLKTIGIAATLSEALEQSDRSADAYVVLEQAFAHMYQHTQFNPPAVEGIESIPVLPEQPTPLQTSPAEAQRAIQLAAHLGALAKQIGRPEPEEERWLTYAAQSAVQLLAESSGFVNMHGPTGSQIADFAIPSWMSSTDAAAPLEALGLFYARRDDVAMALTLYLRAATILLGVTKPSPSQPGDFVSDANVPVIDACRGGKAMSNISELILRTPPSSPSASKEQDASNTSAQRLPSNLAGALHWATGALSIFEQADKRRRKGDVKEAEACDRAHVAALLNMTMLMQMTGSTEEAGKYFGEAMVRAHAAKMTQFIQKAHKELRRLLERPQN